MQKSDLDALYLGLYNVDNISKGLVIHNFKYGPLKPVCKT